MSDRPCTDCGHPAHLHADLGGCLLVAPMFGLFADGVSPGWVRYGPCPCERGQLELEAKADADIAV